MYLVCSVFHSIDRLCHLNDGCLDLRIRCIFFIQNCFCCCKGCSHGFCTFCCVFRKILTCPCLVQFFQIFNVFRLSYKMQPVQVGTALCELDTECMNSCFQFDLLCFQCGPFLPSAGVDCLETCNLCAVCQNIKCSAACIGCRTCRQAVSSALGNVDLILCPCSCITVTEVFSAIFVRCIFAPCRL